MKDQIPSAGKSFPTDVYSGGRAFNAIFESKLDPSDKLIMSAIASKMDFRKHVTDCSWSLSIEALIRMTGLGRMTVFRHLKKLCGGDDPYIRRENRHWPNGAQKWNVFSITPRVFLEHAAKGPDDFPRDEPPEYELIEDCQESREHADRTMKDVQQNGPYHSETGGGGYHGDTGEGITAIPLNTPPLNSPIRKEKKKKEEGEKTLPLVASGAVRSPGTEIWEAYEKAYRARYGVAPIRDKMANTFCKRVSETLPMDVAPKVAAFFVSHNDAYYVRTCHDLRQLACDAKKLHTEFQTGMVTGSKARQIEKSSTNRDAFLEVYKRRQARKGDEEAS